MATVEDFKLRIKVEGEGAIKNLSGTIEKLSNDISQFGVQSNAMTGVLGSISSKLGPVGLAATAVAGAFIALGGRALQLAGELSDISGATGIAAGTLMNFRQSVVEAGGKAEDFAQIASKLNQSIQEANSGNEKFQESFRNLGVYVTDVNGKLRPTEEILRDILDKFQSGELTSKQYAAAIDILGKNINKLELAKLQALSDPIKDEQIRQLDKYNDAIDKLAETVNNKLISAFGSLAESINKGIDKLDELSRKNQELERQANLRGNTRQPLPGATGPAAGVVNPFGFGGAPAGERKMLEEELAAFKKLEKARNEAAQARLMSPYKTRARSDDAEGGGFGATPEATIKAVQASEVRIANAKLEAARAGELQRNTEEFAIRMKAVEQRKIIELKSEQEIAAVKINLESDLAKAKSEIFAQERLNAQQKEAEFQAKTVELTAKAEEAKAKLRQRLSEDLKREEERIQKIIDTTRQYTKELESQTDLTKRRLEFNTQTALYTERERRAAEQLLQLEEDRLREIRRLNDIKDLPQDERLSQEAAINREFSKRKQLANEQAEADLALSENFSAGYQKAYRQYVEDSRNAFEQAGRYFETFTRGFEDAFVNFVKTGKLSFKDLVNDMIAQIARIQAQKFLTSIFGSTDGKAGTGGLFGGSIIPGFLASGGPAAANMPYIVGEEGPELFIPRTAGTVIPNGTSIGNSSAPSTNVVTYNISAVDAMSFKQMIARDPSFIHAVAMQGGKSIPGRY